MMPQINGLQLAQQLHSDPETAGIPVLAMTVALPPHLADEFVAVLPKPFALNDLVAIVCELGADHTKGFQQSDKE